MDRNPNNNRPVCSQCQHFCITWDPAFPYGCRAMGFKSKHHPSVAVLSSSGIRCLQFEKKWAKGKGKSRKDQA